jgi:DNA-binding NarL/FixJ family response regulator
LTLLAEGLGSRAIATDLVISTKTVASHVQRILAKLGAHSRAEAIAIAYRDGLVTIRALRDDDHAEVAAHLSAVAS